MDRRKLGLIGSPVSYHSAVLSAVALAKVEALAEEAALTTTSLGVEAGVYGWRLGCRQRTGGDAY